MREILYRGKRTDNGEWVYGSLLEQKYRYFQMDSSNEYRKFIANSTFENQRGYGQKINLQFEIVEVDKETVGQYTGLDDKNGTKIFEGDIVKGKAFMTKEYTRHIGEVKNICQSFKSVGINKYKGMHAEINGLFEVIGNIHEREVEE